MPFPFKPRFTWTEPKEFFATEDARETATRKWWWKPALVLTFAVNFSLLILPQQLLEQRYPRHGSRELAPPQETFVCWLLLGAFLTYGVPWLRRIPPSRVLVNGEGLFGTKYKAIQFRDYRCFYWEQSVNHATLVLIHQNGRLVRIGVPVDVPRDEVSIWLCRHGLQNDKPPRLPPISYGPVSKKARC